MMFKTFLLVICFSLSNQQQDGVFQSLFRLTTFGNQFQPQNSIELLATISNVLSLSQCSMMCNLNRQCRTFDYDQSSLVCRLFEGEISTGTILTNSTSLVSRIGAIVYNPATVSQLYSAYNQACDQCTSVGNRYLQCVNNTCQCPQNTYWTGQRCANQGYNGSNCSSSMLSCRGDLNLTCSNKTKLCGVYQPIPICYNISFQQPPQLYTTGNGPQALISVDFNHDNHLDLAVTNYGADSISILLGFGNGSFSSSPMTYASNGSNPYWLTAHDFNNDGNLDLAVANEITSTVAIFLGFGNGSFQAPPQLFASGGNWPSSIIGVDLNNDNNIDLVVANTDTNFITVFLGLGNGSFQMPGQSYPAANKPSAITSGDFNTDGNIDVAVVSRGSNQLLIFIGLGNGNFSNNVATYGTGANPYSVRTADFNFDSKLDLAVVNSFSNSMNIFLGTGNGTFISAFPAAYPSTGIGTFDLTIGDLNGDSVSDIAVSNSASSDLTVYLGYRNGTFIDGKIFTSAGTNLQSIISNDFNEDGLDDLAVINNVNNAVAILLAICPQN